MADVFYSVCDVCLVDRWAAAERHDNIGVVAALRCAMYSLQKKRPVQKYFCL